jgi:hypothetical protein
MSCGEYRVHDKSGRATAVVVFHDHFAEGFPRLERIGNAPCAGEPAPRSGLRKAIDYVRAEVGLLVKGKVAAEVYQARVAACRECPALVKSDQDAVGFCGACGCGTRKRARIGETKAWMPDSVCPRGRW